MKLVNPEVIREIARQAHAQTKLFKATLIIAIATLVLSGASLVVATIAMLRPDSGRAGSR